MIRHTYAVWGTFDGDWLRLGYGGDGREYVRYPGHPLQMVVGIDERTRVTHRTVDIWELWRTGEVKIVDVVRDEDEA